MALAVLAGALIGVLAVLPRGNAALSPTPGATTPGAAPATGGTSSSQPSANPSPTRLATVDPTAAPATAVAVQGGDLGAGKAFRTATGEGEAAIDAATWTNSGDIAPPQGRLYLVLAVSVTGREGALPIDTLSFRAIAADGSARTPAFGPDLDEPLGGDTIEAGSAATGQIGFVLPPGATTIELLDADLLPVAAFEVPGP